MKFPRRRRSRLLAQCSMRCRQGRTTGRRPARLAIRPARPCEPRLVVRPEYHHPVSSVLPSKRALAHYQCSLPTVGDTALGRQGRRAMSVRLTLVGAIAAATLSSAAHTQGSMTERSMTPAPVFTPTYRVGAIAAKAQARVVEKKGSAPLHRELQIQATVGQEVRVYGHLRLSKDCGRGPVPEMTIVKTPSIGTLTARIESVTLTEPNFGNCSAGHAGMGKVVYYQATSAGADAFEYQMSSPGLPTTIWSVNVEIR